MKTLKITALLISTVIVFAACSKNGGTAVVSQPQIQVGQPVSNSAPLTGTIKGTMETGLTYIINGDVTINAGDTLLIQKGVTVQVNNGSNFFVNGTMVSLGTKDAPVIITDPRRTKTTGTST
ncbi:MAG: hypothetical protein M3Z92_01480, partial [Bacteroidota bacterium]|nr:hypothetical protein [Bacteroidota bacterium]